MLLFRPTQKLIYKYHMNDIIDMHYQAVTAVYFKCKMFAYNDHITGTTTFLYLYEYDKVTFAFG